MREHLRKYLEVYWRPFVIKKECEECGSTEKLHLHHIDYFSHLFNGHFPESKEGLTKEEIRDYEARMLQIHVEAVKSKTLCEECHFKAHSEGKKRARTQKATPENKRDQLLIETCLGEPHISNEKIISLRKKDLYESEIKNKEALLEWLKDKPDKAYVFPSRVGGGNKHIDIRRCQQILKIYAPMIRG